MKYASVVMVIALLCCYSIVVAAENKVIPPKVQSKKAEVKPKPLPTAIITQGDFAREIVTVLGWGDGLLEELTDRDYLQILEGRRTFKFEAEKVYSSTTDNVSVRKNELLGPFTGESWLGGISVPSLVRMKVYIPIAGDYTLNASAKGNSQVWKIAGKEFSANSGNTLALTKIASLNLKPGEHEIELLLPPEGGLDYLVFTAPDFTPIEPPEGWRFNDSLTNLAMSYVVSSLLGLGDDLPVDEATTPVTVVVSELKNLPATVTLSDIGYHGKFTGKTWVSTADKSAEISIPFTLPHNGTYDVKLRVKGSSFSFNLNGNQFKMPAKPSLGWVSLGLQRLPKGQNSMLVKVPAYGGIDALVITARKSSPDIYMNLAGITGDPGGAVTYSEMEKVLSRVRERFTIRK